MPTTENAERKLSEIVGQFNVTNPEIGLSYKLEGLCLTLRLSGALGYDVSIGLGRCLVACAECAPEGGSIVIDVADLYYISSTGVGAFMAVLSSARQRGLGFAVINPQESVSKIFDLLGMTAFFKRG
jgi:anti-anti-sigma factor